MLGVIGSAEADGGEYESAVEVGREIARRGFTLVCGGLGGVMEAACRGAKSEGGETVGIIPGSSRAEANPFVDLVIVTNMGHARNVIIAQTANAIIALPGTAGTLSEIALALKVGTPVVALDAWDGIEGIHRAKSPKEAVEKAAKLAGK